MTVPDPGLLDEAAETTTHTEPVEDAALVEAVARAIDAYFGPDRVAPDWSWQDWLGEARAAIAAVRAWDAEQPASTCQAVDTWPMETGVRVTRCVLPAGHEGWHSELGPRWSDDRAP